MQSEEGFQIATLVVIVVTVLACMGFMLIFVNPQVVLNPFKPPIATSTFVALVLPATWTPTFTPSPTPTYTPTPTLTPSITPTPTSTVTDTPVASPTRTRAPFTRTPRPPTPSPWTYFALPRGCQHSGGTYIEGYVTNPSGEEAGTRVTLGTAPGSNVVQTLTTGSNRSPGYYTFVLNANGASPGTWYVWITDVTGRALSDPNTGRVTTNAIKSSDDPNSCWQAFIDFARH
jgi:hypothetical protein